MPNWISYVANTTCAVGSSLFALLYAHVLSVVFQNKTDGNVLGECNMNKPSLHKAALKTLIANTYRDSVYLTAKDLCGYGDMTEFTHGPMCQALQSPKKRKLIVMPRGTFKSSIGVVGYIVWLIINNPNIRILVDSEKYQNSKNFIREIKGKLEQPEITRIFGEFKSDSKWAEGEFTIKQRTKLLKEATVTASGINAGKTGQHYSVIICDDMNTSENSENSDQRKKIIRHYQMNTSILEPDGTMVIIGTRYAMDDIIGHILSTEVNV